MKEITVTNNDDIRLDAYVASVNPELTRATVQRLLEEGNILVNKCTKKRRFISSN